ncbi:hypothetical protein ACFPVX_12015 [Cohnella faecalis]|uniref:Uncharacterized protein n=1 Tax=Cohnella faecalis TaxID=2315694 RepID=A0A398CMX1_9BACL|nr:hypothetical protein [Cohnella faecalis]RIE03642.1 hypothetical protein D3H35_10095 [Cohnella faecalis]
MDTYELASLSVAQGSEALPISFSRAKLMVVSDYGTRLWFIDVEGVADEQLLQRFAVSEEIGVSVKATTIGGRRLEGHGFFHPNPIHRAAAIRGNGELEGYGNPA